MADPNSPPEDSKQAPAGEATSDAEALQDVVNQRLEELGYLDYGRDI